MVYCCRSSRQGCRSQRSSDLQYVSAGSAKYDVRTGDVITWKQQQQQQQQQLYSRQSSQQMMRQQPAVFLSERDYATTLQMRRSAAQPTSPLLRPLPTETFEPAAAACSCPLHGHLAPPLPAVDDDLPPPPSPLQSATSPRFSSFRPRVEHIYEVPKFADGGGNCELDDDDAAAVNCASTLYSELDTRSFGTVGRRTPSTRGRQPYSSLQS